MVYLLRILNYYANGKSSATCVIAYVYANTTAKSMAVNGVCLRDTIVNSTKAA